MTSFSPSGSSIPSGTVFDFAGSTAPTGFLLCYGQAVSRTDYANLFTTLGTTYGVGDGSTTFNLPDLRGRVVAGKDDMGGTSADRLTDQSGGLNGDTLGGTGGAETHTLDETEIPAHVHAPLSGESFLRKGSGSLLQFGGGSTTYAGVPTTAETGGDGPHNNVQPTIILNKIIKT